jgi:hypothetical protein
MHHIKPPIGDFAGLLSNLVHGLPDFAKHLYKLLIFSGFYFLKGNTRKNGGSSLTEPGSHETERQQKGNPISLLEKVI